MAKAGAGMGLSFSSASTAASPSSRLATMLVASCCRGPDWLACLPAKQHCHQLQQLRPVNPVQVIQLLKCLEACATQQKLCRGVCKGPRGHLCCSLPPSDLTSALDTRCQEHLIQALRKGYDTAPADAGITRLTASQTNLGLVCKQSLGLTCRRQGPRCPHWSGPDCAGTAGQP